MTGQGCKVSQKLVGTLPRQLKYGCKANHKTREGAGNPDRDAQFRHINTTGPDGAVMKVGSMKQADLIVLATGYEGQAAAPRRMLDDEVGDGMGPVWGFDDECELRGMWRPTGQPGLWFHAGGLAQCRIFSKVLALQTKARELGITA